MSKYWLTPEEAMSKKKRNKLLLNVSLIIGTIVLSALFTFLANNI
ncbi:hypothetical protein [Bacillus sp. AFS073361]|nr:hypothetical protein [Bacillus sp. AFS073361]